MLTMLVDFDGKTHVVSPIGGSEHTLCGVASDAADSEDDESLRWEPPARPRQATVDCDDCASVVRACRGIRVSEPS